MTAAESEFVAEKTRDHLVRWAEQQVCGGSPVIEEGPFRAFAIEKGWISSKEMKVLAAGFKVAAAYLRR